jgi:hypothetical protein
MAKKQRTFSDEDLPEQMHTPPIDQGQIVEYSYGATPEGVFMHVLDRSDRTEQWWFVPWSKAKREDKRGDTDYWNRRPLVSDKQWEKITVSGIESNPGDNLVQYMNVYRDGELWVVVETGMPQDNVQVGVGDTLREAYDSREGTAIQSAGRDSGLRAALRWAEGAGWIDSVSGLDEVDDAELYDDEEENPPRLPKPGRHKVTRRPKSKNPANDRGRALADRLARGSSR